MTCEKCWTDSFDFNNLESHYERYRQLLIERKDNPCTPEQQAGQFWDKEKQVDTRSIRIHDLDNTN